MEINNKHIKSEGGFTLVELLITVAIFLIFLPFAASMLFNSKLLASYAQHKMQAAYAAQQILETERQAAFITTATVAVPVIIGPNSVVLDTKGNYNNTTCAVGSSAFCGTSVITVTPTVYTSPGGTATTSTTVDHFLVKIYWNEKIGKSFIPMTEYYAEDIANGTMLN